MPRSPSASTATPTVSLRRSKSRFRFDAGRDDVSLKGLTCRVFTTQSPLLNGGKCADVGVYACPVGVLIGYQSVENGSKMLSVRAAEGEGAYVLGRLVELTMSELARLDQVAELSGDYHRFEADVKTTANGHSFKAWVYQLLADAGPDELDASATTNPPQNPPTNPPRITEAFARIHSLPIAQPTLQ